MQNKRNFLQDTELSELYWQHFVHTVILRADLYTWSVSSSSGQYLRVRPPDIALFHCQWIPYGVMSRCSVSSNTPNRVKSEWSGYFDKKDARYNNRHGLGPRRISSQTTPASMTNGDQRHTTKTLCPKPMALQRCQLSRELIHQSLCFHFSPLPQGT